MDDSDKDWNVVLYMGTPEKPALKIDVKLLAIAGAASLNTLGEILSIPVGLLTCRVDSIYHTSSTPISWKVKVWFTG